MLRSFLASLLIFTLSLIALSSCGGGSSSQPQGPTTAVIKIETLGTLDQDTLIYGITVSGVLPEGVSVKTTTDEQNPSGLVTDSGVVTASGVTGPDTWVLATYEPTDRKVTIQVSDPVGFDTGEFVTVTCDIAAGSTPTADSFGLEGFELTDVDGRPINGITSGFTVDIF